MSDCYPKPDFFLVFGTDLAGTQLNTFGVSNIYLNCACLLYGCDT